MALYPKKLHNVDDLKKERSKLLKKVKHLERDGFLSTGMLTGALKNGENGDSNFGLFADIPELLKPILNLVKDIVLKRLGKKEEKEDNKYRPSEKKDKGRSLLRSAAIEFIGGYLKWKAIELSFKGLRKFLRK
jgi:hypothetical protein